MPKLEKIKTKIYFVPHTHWDKEWYFTKETSSVFLVDNIQKLKKIAENKENFSHHVYDSQISVIDDYLSFYPEDEEVINKLIKEKKLIVGPWYTQPDMFSPSGESILRNLSIGKTEATKRGFSAKEAYTPDSFGFNGNLPQILKHNECDAIIQWRGVDNDHIKKDLLNIWEGVDGSTVYLYNMYKYGYGLTFWAFNSVYKKWNLNNMSELAKEYLDKFKNEFTNLKDLISRSLTPYVCFPFGSDQSPIIEFLPQFINELNKIDEDNEWILSDYDRFIKDIVNNYDKNNFNIINGELKYGQFSRAHRTIGSSRYDIKSLNKKTEYLLYNISEPLGIIYYKFTNIYQDRIYEKALKWLLESHAHDSMGGSCTDEVNNSVINRILKAKNLLTSQNTLIKRRIIEYLNLDENAILLFNLKPEKRKVHFKINLLTKSRNFKLFYKNNEIKFNLLKSIYYDRTNFIIDENYMYKKNKSEKGFFNNLIEFDFDSINGLDYEIIEIKEFDDNEFEIIKKINSNVIENEFFRVKILDKKFLIHDKLKNKEVFMYLEYENDGGDTYDYSPSNIDHKIISDFKILDNWIENQNEFKKMNVSLEYEIPKNIQDKSNIKQKIDLQCNLNNKNIFFNINMDNKGSECRWRIIFDTNILNSNSYSDNSSAFIKRLNYDSDRMNKWEVEKWKDMPVSIENFYSFVYIKDNSDNFGIYSDQLGEYQLTGDNFSKLAITMFRSVPIMGKRNLQYRPGRASGVNDFPYYTPESNLNKNLEFSFGILFNNNITVKDISDLFGGNDYFQNQKISDYLLQGKTFWKPIVEPKNNFIKPTNIFKNIYDDIVISATKISYDKKNIVIRINNIGNKKYNLKNMICDEYINKIFETNALEKKFEKLSDFIGPNEIKTLIFNI